MLTASFQQDDVKASPTFGEDAQALMADSELSKDFISILQSLSGLPASAEEPPAKKPKVA